MPKKLLQDILPKAKRERAVSDSPRKVVREEKVVEEKPYLKTRKQPRREGPKTILWIFAAVAIIALAVALITVFFSSARVKVTPRENSPQVDADFEIARTGKELSYNTFTIEDDFKENVEATHEEDANKKASGTILIYNNYATTSQRLIRNTRFETPKNLIFRLDSSVVVPGRKLVGGKWIPGTVEALVIADVAGADYNIGLSDFTIPAFKGTPKYTALYGRSKTAMSGGFIGKQKVLTPDEIKGAQSRIEARALQELQSKTKIQATDNFVLLKNAYSFATSSETVQNADDSTITVGEHATLRAVFFPKEALASAIAKKTIPDWNGNPVTLLNPGDISFVSKDATLQTFFDAKAVTVHIKGKALIRFLFDVAKLKKDLAGQQRGDVPTILSGYKSIEKAEVTLSPFWRRTLPSQVEKIKIDEAI